MDNFQYEKLSWHVGHNIVCVNYKNWNIAIECEDCGVVLYDENNEEGEQDATKRNVLEQKSNAGKVPVQ